MGKLLKPPRMDEILKCGKVIRSRKQFTLSPWLYDSLTACWRRYKDGYNSCAVINYTEQHCDIRCRRCFLQANNYLNILKYIKHHGQKRMD